jgi:long-chain acyl-CoA synthetase
LQSFEVASLVESDLHSNITDLLLQRVSETPNLPLFALDTDKGWKDLSGAGFLEQVQDLAKGFIAAGIQPGQAVGIMSKTRFEWTLIDFALWFAGAIPVPIYESSAPSQMEWILSDSDAVALIVENAELLKRFEEIKNEAPWFARFGRLNQMIFKPWLALAKRFLQKFWNNAVPHQS